MELLTFISFFLNASWDFFTEVTVPGFNFTFGALFVGLFLAALALKFLFAMLGVSGGSGDFFHFSRSNSKKGDKE